MRLILKFETLHRHQFHSVKHRSMYPQRLHRGSVVVEGSYISDAFLVRWLITTYKCIHFCVPHLQFESYLWPSCVFVSSLTVSVLLSHVWFWKSGEISTTLKLSFDDADHTLATTSWAKSNIKITCQQMHARHVTNVRYTCAVVGTQLCIAVLTLARLFWQTHQKCVAILCESFSTKQKVK